MDKASSQEFQKRLGRMEELIGALENGPDEIVREQVRELIQTLLELHGSGLERIMSRVYDSPAGGSAMIDELRGKGFGVSVQILTGIRLAQASKNGHGARENEHAGAFYLPASRKRRFNGGNRLVRRD
jgi:hypothetical protein